MLTVVGHHSHTTWGGVNSACGGPSTSLKLTTEWAGLHASWTRTHTALLAIFSHMVSFLAPWPYSLLPNPISYSHEETTSTASLHMLSSKASSDTISNSRASCLRGIVSCVGE